MYPEEVNKDHIRVFDELSILIMGESDYIMPIGACADAEDNGLADRHGTVLVIDEDLGRAENLKELIEFMDTPSVITAIPDDWRGRLGEGRLEALFVGPGLSDEVVEGLLAELEQIDPNVPIIMIQSRT